MIKWLYKICGKIHKLSVIIPTYKNINYLEECVRSVIRSAKICNEYEILLGIDNCYETLRFVSNNKLFKNKRIKLYFFPKNVGPYLVRNSLASISNYDNILFFDSDDVMMKSTIKTIMNKFQNKEILKFKFYNFFDGSNFNDVENLSISNIFSHGAFLIKKEKFLRMNGFYGWKCGADTEFDERYRGQKNNIPVLDIPLFYRRYHQNNITKSSETGLNSKLRNKYGNFIIDNRKNEIWNNPASLVTRRYNIINT